MKIYATYKNGIDSAKDKAAFAIADKYGAKFQGSGCWLHKPFIRDLEWEVDEKSALAMTEELSAAGLGVYFS